jgi:hypothetical protein
VGGRWGRCIIARQVKKELNAPMEKQQLVYDLIEFLTTDSACQKTLSCLDKKAEIGINIAQAVEIRVLYENNKVRAEQAQPMAPDFVFTASPEAIAVLISEKNLSPAQLGIKMLKQIVSRDIKVAMPSNIMQVTRKGYFKIMKLGGKEFLQELKGHNLASLPKVIAALKNLRS